MSPAPSQPAAPAFALKRVVSEGGAAALRLSGRLLLGDASALWTALREQERVPQKGEALDFEMSAVEELDGAAMALLAALRTELHRRGVRSEFVGAGASVAEIVHLYGGDLPAKRLKRQRAVGTLQHIGDATIEVLLELKLVLSFFGQMVLSAMAVLRKPRSANWKEVPFAMDRCGADGVPIVALINFLIGLAMAFQASAQLRRFGANHLVADMIGISVTRELGPLMTAIVVCGRSGAAFAAELGFMRVNEEVDALQTMGFGVMRFLVLPRALALVLVLPLLTIVADLAGVAGGLVVGLLSLDLTITGYLQETARSVTIGDISTGLIKSVIFALAIALIACQQGLATTGGAEGVGRRTTSAVVITLFTLIVIDASATVFFRLAGI